MAREPEPFEVPEPRVNPHLIGHEAAEKDYLAAWSSGRLAHAWLICGPRGIGKATLAHRMARCALKQGGKDDGASDMFGAPPPPTSLQMSAEDPLFRRIAAGGHGENGQRDGGNAATEAAKHRAQFVAQA